MISISQPIRLILLLTILMLPAKARAHSGLPFPVLLDQQLGPYTVSVWADPDVGAGLFIIEVTPTLPPAEISVYLRVRQLDGTPARSDGVTYTAAQQIRTDTGAERFIVRLPFEAEGYWQVDLSLDSAAGAITTRFNLEATPPRQGRLNYSWSLSPLASLSSFGGSRYAGPRQYLAMPRTSPRNYQNNFIKRVNY